MVYPNLLHKRMLHITCIKQLQSIRQLEQNILLYPWTSDQVLPRFLLFQLSFILVFFEFEYGKESYWSLNKKISDYLWFVWWS